MLFSFKYLAATLFGAQGMKIREDKIQAKVVEIKARQDESVEESVQDYEKIKQQREMEKKLKAEKCKL